MAARPRAGWFEAGDALRAVAALSVLVFHCWLVAVLATRGGGGGADLDHGLGPLGPLLGEMSAGLYVFFVLSGYLVGGPYVRALVTGEPRPATLPFLGRRLRRIVPAFWLVALLTLARHGTAGSGIWGPLAVFGFAQEHHPTRFATFLDQAWTLDVEMAFYVAVPLAAAAAASLLHDARRARRVAAVACGLAATAVISIAVARSAGPLHKGLVPSLFAFVPGLALAAAEPFAHPALRGRRSLGRMLALALAGAAASGLALLVVLPRTGGASRPLAEFLCAGGLVGAALAHEWATGSAPRVLTARPLRALGRWSYGIYLVHWGLALEAPALLGGHVHSPAAAFALVLPAVAALSIGLGAASWRFVEHPALAARRRERAGPAVPAPAAAAG